MAVFKKAGRPFYYYDFIIQGHRFQGSTKAETKRQAERVEARIKAETLAKLSDGKAGRKPTTSLDTAAGRYMAERGDLLPSKRSIESELTALLDAFGDNTQLQQIDDERIAIAVTGWRQAGKSPYTINNYLGCLKRLLDRARTIWDMQTGPERHWSTHRMPAEQPRERELSAAEQDRLVAVLESAHPDLLDMITLALLTGKRLAALRTLAWQDVDRDAGYITFREKTRRQVETHRLPITAPIEAFLDGKQGEHPVYVLTYKAERTQKRYNIERGKRYPFNQDGWRKRWWAALEAAGINDFRFHDLRHTFGSRTTRSSRNLRLTQALMNHKQITTTQRYTHVLDDDMRAALSDPGLAPARRQSPPESLPESEKKSSNG